MSKLLVSVDTLESRTRVAEGTREQQVTQAGCVCIFSHWQSPSTNVWLISLYTLKASKCLDSVASCELNCQVLSAQPGAKYCCTADVVHLPWPSIVCCIGSDVRHIQLNSSCAGDALYSSRTMFLKPCYANWTSLPVSNAFFIRFFTVPMARSAYPLLCEYHGLLVTCSMPHNCVNVRNSQHEKRSPLSETSHSGEP